MQTEEKFSTKIEEENRGFDKITLKLLRNRFYVEQIPGFTNVENFGYSDLQKKVKNDKTIENKGKNDCGKLCGKCE